MLWIENAARKFRKQEHRAPQAWFRDDVLSQFRRDALAEITDEMVELTPAGRIIAEALGPVEPAPITMGGRRDPSFDLAGHLACAVKRYKAFGMGEKP